MRVPITLSLHIPNFNYPGVGPDEVFEKIAAIANTCEASGFSSVSVMDHLHQIGPVGPPTNYMFEGSTMLAAIAARTRTLTMGLMVGSVTYRNPALAAKVTTTLDVISGGRVWHGIGAGWFEAEHVAYGYDFPPLARRFELLEEELQIVRAMFTSAEAHFDGAHLRVAGAYNNPKPLRGDIPILIGGSGERKTLRLVAKYGDGCNLFAADAQRARHLLGVLEAHCADVGRDFSEITKTALGRVLIAPTHEQAEAKKAGLRERGVPQENIDSLIAGDPDTVGERVQALKDAGLEGYCFSMPDSDDLETVTLAGETLSKLFPRADSAVSA
ncbi:MAG TPA: LLM class F420-dependent oxidoreductase [Solirubrobacteraceae bacterium]|jgi:F420-dependent oxidoreductase-like protein|nr:LLM class F420-dependent oxidoreductase [Solirubrobacteraceae bacterium]